MANCPDCGSIVMEGDSYCSHCGAHLVWIDDDSDDDYQDVKDMRECLNCGEMNEDDYDECEYCG